MIALRPLPPSQMMSFLRGLATRLASTVRTRRTYFPNRICGSTPLRVTSTPRFTCGGGLLREVVRHICGDQARMLGNDVPVLCIQLAGAGKVLGAGNKQTAFSHEVVHLSTEVCMYSGVSEWSRESIHAEGAVNRVACRKPRVPKHPVVRLERQQRLGHPFVLDLPASFAKTDCHLGDPQLLAK